MDRAVFSHFVRLLSEREQYRGAIPTFLLQTIWLTPKTSDGIAVLHPLYLDPKIPQPPSSFTLLRCVGCFAISV
jgi:hypothetical protein